MIDFDLVIDRSGSPAEKWNKPALLKHFGRDDLLPFWVADMEFKAPPTVYGSLIERAENGIFGYEYKQASLYNAIIQWYSTRHHWKIDKPDLRFSRGILNAISMFINLHTEEGDGIIIQPPVFFEFRLAIRDNKRNVIRNPLKRIDERYQMDFDDLEEKAADPRTKMLINKTNAFSVVAMETAYQTGGEWLDQVLDYLQGNLSYLNDYLIDRIPKVRLVEPEGTFLAWLDFRELGMEAKELEVFLAEKARLALNSGYWFGRQGAGYARMTIACPQSMLKEALARLEHATKILT